MRGALAALAAAVFAAAAFDGAMASRKVTFTDARNAFKHGISGYQQGKYDIAVPALEFAAARGVVVARYFLAKIYADTNSRYGDPAKSYHLFKRIVADYKDADFDDPRRAYIVSRSWTAIGRYVRAGIPSIGLKSDLAKAIEYFRYSATMFDDEDAQFELAKLQLTGEGGVAKAVPQALNWFAALSRRGHAGAQAFLADLYWRGKYTPQNLETALALINVAVENAAPEDQVWIEDIHQNIFCSTSAGTRRAATVLVADWRRRYVRPRASTDRLGLDSLSIGAIRRCSNGEVVRSLVPQRSPREVVVAGNGPAPSKLGATGPKPSNTPARDLRREFEIMMGNMLFGVPTVPKKPTK
ncbi:MAG: sel1 repeat family protein [Hyphomicrobiaceae bacterium]|nr:sel1 repeat family protein [Hyphomicrobiaceae bacterium]